MLRPDGQMATPSSSRTQSCGNGPGDDMAMEDRMPLEMDSAIEQRSFTGKHRKFAFSPEQIYSLVGNKSLQQFRDLGGLAGLERGLRTDRQRGLSATESLLDDYISGGGDKGLASVAALTDPSVPDLVVGRDLAVKTRPFDDRKRVFQDNPIPSGKPPRAFRSIWMTYFNYVLFLLMVAAAVSLGLGLYQALRTERSPSKPPREWVEGAAIMTAVVVVVIVKSANDHWNQHQFSKLDDWRQTEREANVTRSGRRHQIPVVNIVVGDVMHLKPGDIVPADGILIGGDNVKCYESSTTGGTGIFCKQPGDEVFRALKKDKVIYQGLHSLDPFLISGSEIAGGTCTFLVTAAGINSTYGKISMSLHDHGASTPLQLKLSMLTKSICSLACVSTLVLFVVLFIEFLVHLRQSAQTPAQKGQRFLKIVIISITIMTVSIPKVFFLAFTHALAFSATKMLKQNCLVQHFKACETMGSITTICLHKTGMLTQNEMAVVAGTIGTALRFGDGYISSLAPTASDSVSDVDEVATVVEDISTAEFIDYLAGDVKEILKQSIVINSTAFEAQDGQQSFVGPNLEAALLTFAQDNLEIGPVETERSSARIVQWTPFNTTLKWMATVVQLEDGKWRMYVKGAPEVLLAKCTAVLHDPIQDVSVTHITADNIQSLTRIATGYASHLLRTISIAYRDFEQWPPCELQSTDEDHPELGFMDLLKDLTFLGIFGISDPVRNGIQDAVHACRRAGVTIRMVTGDNMSTAKAVAEQCGILSDEDLVLDGVEFRRLTSVQLSQIIPRLRVLAGANPRDKQTLVTLLKRAGEVVAVTGNGTADAPVLGAPDADVKLSMGISGTEVSKRTSSIVLLDDSLSSIAKAITWGRYVDSAVKKCLQFQITTWITSSMLAIISAIASSGSAPVPTAVQLLWINILQDILAVLALGTDSPSARTLDHRPVHKSEPLISVPMWKMIIGQSCYQLSVNLVLYFRGVNILSYGTVREQNQLRPLIFNIYVWMQIFNVFNNRRIDNEFNIFEGIFGNWVFIASSICMISCQILIMFVGGRAFSIFHLNAAQWAYSLVLGALSIIIGCIVRLIPNERLSQFGLTSQASSRLPGP